MDEIEMSSEDQTLSEISNDCNSGETESKNEHRKTIEDLFSLFIRHKFTLVALEDTAKVINAISGSKIRLPTNKYSLLRDFLSASPYKVFQYYCCEVCKNIKCEFSQRNKPTCCHRKVKKDNFFVYINMQEQLQSIVKRHFVEIMKFREAMKDEKNITDTYSAYHVKNLSQTNENIYSMTLSTDGVLITKSNNSSMWPIEIICNFLPPNIRFKNENILVCALAKGKPDMLEFFRPLAEEFVYLSDGIFITDRIFRFYVTNASLDLPAKSAVSQIK